MVMMGWDMLWWDVLIRYNGRGYGGMEKDSIEMYGMEKDIIEMYGIGWYGKG